MSRRLLTLTICAALVPLSGCGSSSSSSSSSSSATVATTGTSASTASTSSSSTHTTGGLKVSTTPKFAPATGPVRSGTVQIAYRNIAIAPDTVRVKLGSTIKWTSYDTVEHNVTSEGGPTKFASKAFSEGGTFELKATKPGVIHYECTFHPTSMNGTIEVVK